MQLKIPNQIVHYSRGEPFRSITDVPLEHLDSVIEKLDEKNSWGLNRFKNQTYFKQRLDVENGMREKFIEMGGNPLLLHPIYFFLGRNQRFEEHPLNIGYSINLSDVQRNSVSFSYGDTMLSFNEENRKLAGELYLSPLCERLFMLDELEELFESKFFSSHALLTIEAHLWVRPDEKNVRKIDP